MGLSLNSVWPYIEEIPITEYDQAISKAIALIQKGNDIIFVVNENQKFEGLIRTRDIVGKGVNPNALCRNYSNRNIPIILESELEEISPTIVGKKMIEGGTRYIPILDNNSKTLGAFKDSTVLTNLILEMEELNEMTAEAVVNWNLVFLSETDTIGTAIAKFREFGISHIPIINPANEIVGIVTDRLLLRKHSERRATTGDIGGSRDQNWHLLPVVDFLISAELIEIDTPLKVVIENFIKLKRHTLFVRSNKEGYGVITALDIIKFILDQSTVTDFNVVVMQAPDENIHNHIVRKALVIMEREKNWLGEKSTIRVRFKRNLSQSKRGQFSITSKVQLISENGYTYNSESTDFGAEKAINSALDNLSRIISTDKKRRLDKRDKSFTKRKITNYS